MRVVKESEGKQNNVPCESQHFVCLRVWISGLSGDAWGRPKHQRGPALILSLLQGPSYLSRAGGRFHGQPTNCVCMSLIPVDVQALGTERDGEDTSPVEIIVWPLNIMSKPR